RGALRRERRHRLAGRLELAAGLGVTRRDRREAHHRRGGERRPASRLRQEEGGTLELRGGPDAAQAECDGEGEVQSLRERQAALLGLARGGLERRRACRTGLGGGPGDEQVDAT